MTVDFKIIVKALINTLGKKIDWERDESTTLKAKTAYNACLNDISQFIMLYEQGKVEQEYINQIVKDLIGEVQKEK